MAFTDAIVTVVGEPTKSSTANNLADNTEFNRTYANIQHNFDISTATGFHKNTIPDTDSTYNLGDSSTPKRWANVYTDALGDTGQTLTVNSPSLTVATAFWLGLGASAGRIVFTDSATDTLSFLNCDVGIGGTPSYEFDLTKASAAAGVITAAVRNTTATGFTRYIVGDDGAAVAASWITYGSSHATRANQTWFGTEAAESLILKTQDIAAITITDGGRITIIGTWQNPFLLGAKRLWYDVTNDVLRTKNSDPSSETGGNILVEG